MSAVEREFIKSFPSLKVSLFRTIRISTIFQYFSLNALSIKYKFICSLVYSYYFNGCHRLKVQKSLKKNNIRVIIIQKDLSKQKFLDKSDQPKMILKGSVKRIDN